MISLAPGTKVYLAAKPVSMRLSFDGLCAMTHSIFAADPFSGHLFLPLKERVVPQDSALGWVGFVHLRQAPGEGAFRLAAACCAHGIELIRELYALEDGIRGSDLEVRRGVRRQARAIAENFFAWTSEVLTRISAKSALAEALRYAVSCKDALLRKIASQMGNLSLNMRA